MGWLLLKLPSKGNGHYTLLLMWCGKIYFLVLCDLQCRGRIAASGENHAKNINKMCVCVKIKIVIVKSNATYVYWCVLRDKH